MNRLFVRIFLWFWLAMTVIGAALVVLALTSDHRKAEHVMEAKDLIPHGNDLIGTAEKRGKEGLIEELRRLEQDHDLWLILYRADLGPVAARELPPEFAAAIKRDASGGNGLGSMETLPQPRLWLPGSPGHHGPPLFRRVSLDKGYTLFSISPPPSPLEIILSPRSLILRTVIAFLVAGITCYILAKSLTAPIAKLRQATQAIAHGNLATRVAPLVGQKMGDITDLANDFDRMAERIERLLTSQQRLLRDISHELRSPLTRLNVALALAQEQALPQTSSALNRIELESERLRDLIGQLRTVTLLESEGERLEQHQLQLQELLRLVVQDADFEAHSSNRSVVIDAPSTAVTMNGSWELLRQAVENVIRNAVRHTEEGTEVTVTMAAVDEGGHRQARIVVRDHGRGVPDEHLPHLFRPFYRVEEARDRASGGSGMGLAIAQRAVALHGGSIRADNAPDGGLQVTILLPLRDVAE